MLCGILAARHALEDRSVQHPCVNLAAPQGAAENGKCLLDGETDTVHEIGRWNHILNTFMGITRRKLSGTQ